MDNKDAKQFSAFSPLKGYHEMIESKEYKCSDQISLTEDKKTELAFKINLLKAGEKSKIFYFSDGNLLVNEGIISKIDIQTGCIIISNMKVNFEDIIDIIDV